MGKYLYEAVLSRNELGGFDVSFPELGVVTMGDDLYDAAFMGQDLLGMKVSSMLRDGEELPAPAMGHAAPEGGYAMVIAVDVDGCESDEEYMTAQEAADLLDVSRSRVYAMVRDGLLRAVKRGNQRLIVAEDVMERFNNPRSAGRPWVKSSELVGV